MAKQNGWFVKKDKTDLVEGDGLQQSTLEYPGLDKDKIFEEVDRFYRTYYLRPKPIMRIIKTMLEDKDILVRRCREGYEFFRSLRERKSDLAAAKAAAALNFYRAGFSNNHWRMLSLMMLQPRLGQINVPLDAAQHFIGDGVFVAELQNRPAFHLQRFVREAFKFGGKKSERRSRRF